MRHLLNCIVMGLDVIAALAIISLIGTLTGYAIQSQNQWDMLDSQQNFNADEAEKSRDWAVNGRFNDMIGLGFNPDLAAASVMGSSSTPGFAAQSPQSPQVPALGSLLQNSLGGMTENLVNQYLNQAYVDNLNANTRKTDVETDWIPLTNAAQIDYWGALTEKAVKEGFVAEELVELYKKQGSMVVPLAQSEIAKNYSAATSSLAQASLFWEEAETQEALQSLYGSEEAVNWQKVLNLKQDIKESDARIRELDSRADLNLAEKYTEDYKGLQERLDFELRNGFLGGLPLTDDVKETLFLMCATPEGKQKADDFIQAYLNGCRELDDLEVELNARNRGKKVWNDIARGFGSVPSKFAEGFGFGAGYSISGDLLSGKGLKGASKEAAKGASARPNVSSRPTASPWSKPVVKKAADGRRYKEWIKPDGNPYREWID